MKSEEHEQTYLVIKRDENGRIYNVWVHCNEELVAHLRGTFAIPGHTLVSVLNVSTPEQESR